MRPDIEGCGRDNPAQASWWADRQATDPAHPAAAQAATDTTPVTPPKKKKRHIGTWIALVSAVAAIISAFIAGKQLSASSQQNTVAEQQQLVALTTTIAQQLNQAQPSTSSGQQAMSAELTLEGQSAEKVITELHGTGVTDTEYYDVAGALAIGEGYTTDAIPYYQKAVTTPPYDVGTQASALRGEAVLYYNLGQPNTGHEYFMRAINVYNGDSGISQEAKDNNIAQSYLADAQYQLGISGCGIASTDINEAKNFLSQAGWTNATNAGLLTKDQGTYSNDCPTGSTGSLAG